jgi:hypothetical protein
MSNVIVVFAVNSGSSIPASRSSLIHQPVIQITRLTSPPRMMTSSVLDSYRLCPRLDCQISRPLGAALQKQPTNHLADWRTENPTPKPKATPTQLSQNHKPRKPTNIPHPSQLSTLYNKTNTRIVVCVPHSNAGIPLRPSSTAAPQAE